MRRVYPACAGEPCNVVMTSPRFWVYPRVCGGTPEAMWRSRQRIGLSPRVRGNLLSRLQHNAQVRSIPACAGEPGTKATCLYAIWVYPRVCGGTAVGLGVSDNLRGLSPRVRGNLDKSVVGVGGERSIPACAGEPFSSQAPSQCRRVYPRVCGGTQVDELELGEVPGLSPRVRGNQVHVADSGNPGRSIPACAGEPRALLDYLNPDTVYPRVCGGTKATCSEEW